MQWLYEWTQSHGLGDRWAPLVAEAIALVGLVLLAGFAHFLTRRVLLRLIERLVRATETDWDDRLVAHRFFHWLAHLVPALTLRLFAPLVLARHAVAAEAVATAAYLYVVLALLLAFNAFLKAVLDIYGTTSWADRVPIKPFVQVLQGLAFFAGAVVLLGTLIGRSPAVLLSGLGAFTAVLLLVFRDPILGLAAGIQLISNNMVRRGDWIEVPKFGADGEVTDVSLTTVSVQNWDKTISTIPTYSLLTDTFRNWRGMEESGGRRIKRAVQLDMTSVKFVDAEMLERFKKIRHIQSYLDEKVAEIQSWNQEREIDESDLINGRRLTNLGVFRAYLERYLKAKPEIHPDLTFLVRQLPPSPKGLPMEIYVFSRDQRWAHYEAIQADIFDHVLAVIPLFDLRVFQEPTGTDLRELARRAAGTV